MLTQENVRIISQRLSSVTTTLNTMATGETIEMERKQITLVRNTVCLL